MTVVRRDAGARTKPGTATARKDGGRAAKRASTRAPSQVAQVRLQADEMAALQEVMRQLRLPSTSAALREGIRLLIREASELAAAEEIRQFYGAAPAPMPDGVIRATDEDIAAADAMQW